MQRRHQAHGRLFQKIIYKGHLLLFGAGFPLQLEHRGQCTLHQEAGASSKGVGGRGGFRALRALWVWGTGRFGVVLRPGLLPPGTGTTHQGPRGQAELCIRSIRAPGALETGLGIWVGSPRPELEASTRDPGPKDRPPQSGSRDLGRHPAVREGDCQGQAPWGCDRVR